MTDDSFALPVDPSEEEKVEPASSLPEATGFVKRIGTRVVKSIHSPRRFIVVNVLVLIIALVLPLACSFGLPFKSSSAPLIITMVTSYNDRQESPGQGLEAWQGAKLYIDFINRQKGGVNGHPLQLLKLNDETQYNSDASIADQVVKSRSLLVLGPIYSAMVPSDVNRIYRGVHIPLITASISSDALTHDNPFAFRLRTLTSSQGNKSATYVRQILGLNTASILRLQGDDSYGKPIADAFTSTFTSQGGRIAQDLEVAQNVNVIASTLAHGPNSGIIFLAMTDLQKARDVIVALRRNHVTAPILCSDAIDSDLFPTLFASYPEERSQPGYFTDGIYASAPVIYDSAPDAAQAFASQYLNTYESLPGAQHAYKGMPGWFGAKYYEAAQVAVQALTTANVQGTPASLSNDRMGIEQQLEKMRSPQTGVEGLDGVLYFDSNHNEGVSQTRFGQFWHRRLRSLPIQLVAVSNPDLVDLPGQMRAGEIVKADNQYFWKQRVVYAGIDLNAVSSINVTNATFTVDFYLWMRYSGGDNATDIAFTNASNVAFDPTLPQSSQIINDPTLPLANQTGGDQRLQYRRYHITGDFKATYDFHQYPFDQQQLNIGFQNTRLTSEHLVYVIDAPGLRLNSDNTAPSSTAAAFQSLSSWTYQDTQYASDTFSSHSTLGDPRLFDLRTQTDYSGLQVTIMIQRKALAYLVSHLLPLMLLILLVYTSLFLPLKHLGDRLTLTVSALLASAVLLLSINSELPDIGYVVSLDYIYYIFFVLCLLCTVVPMFMEWLDEQEHTIIIRFLNIGLHLTYLAVVVATICYYLITYGNRLA